MPFQIYWQEGTSERWGNPLSSRPDRLSRRHVILGPLLVSVILFVVSSLAIWALFGLYLVIVCSGQAPTLGWSSRFVGCHTVLAIRPFPLPADPESIAYSE